MGKIVEATTSESKSFKKQQDWLPLLTGGLASASALGWCVYRSVKPPQPDSKEMMAIIAFLAGGIGASVAYSVYFRRDQKSTDNDLLNERYARVVKEVKKTYDFAMAKEGEDLYKLASLKRIPETDEVPYASEYMTRLEKMETCSDEVMGSQKAKFKEAILSNLNKLKDFVLGTLGHLPSARNNKFWTTETSDEVRQYGVMIVKEYTNSMLPRIEQAIDEFVNSVYKAEKVLDYDKDLKIKARENDQRPKNAFADNIQPLESNQSCEKIPTETSELPPLMPKSASPNSRGGEAEASHPEAEIAKTSSDGPRQLTQKEEDKLSFLKLEIKNHFVDEVFVKEKFFFNY